MAPTSPPNPIGKLRDRQKPQDAIRKVRKKLYLTSPLGAATGLGASRQVPVATTAADTVVENDVARKESFELAYNTAGNGLGDEFLTDSKVYENLEKDILIAVMGVTGSGKSTFISLLSGETIPIGHSQRSCTQNVGVYHFTLEGMRVWLIDTPGFDDTHRSDTDVLKDIAYWLAGAYTKKVKLAGLIYLHRITDNRMQGSALKNLKLLKELCGSDNLKSVILATTHWTHAEGKTVSDSVGQARVQELTETEEFWGGMVDHGSCVEKHDGTKESATRIVWNLVSRHHRFTLEIQKQLVDQKMNLLQTAAGQALQREWMDERKKTEAQLAKLKSDMQNALQEKDQIWQKQIQQSAANLKAQIRQSDERQKRLEINLEKIVSEKDEQFRAAERRWEKDRLIYEERLREAMRKLEALKAQNVVSSPTDREERMYTDEERQWRARAEELKRFRKRQLQALYPHSRSLLRCEGKRY